MWKGGQEDKRTIGQEDRTGEAHWWTDILIGKILLHHGCYTITTQSMRLVISTHIKIVIFQIFTLYALIMFSF